MLRDSFGVRAPGRVNLIGEHIDYCGLPVLPIAIQRAIALAVRSRPDATVTLTNADPAFPPRQFLLARDIPRRPPGDWGNYAQAAAQVLLRHVGGLRGMDVQVRSGLPAAAGLSSSSALVVALALALLRVNRRTLDPLELATILAGGERYVGTAGGGMDQAIIIGARPGHAALIHFEPLRWDHVPVPTGWRFVVASTLERAEKSGAAQAAYNARTTETAAARQAVGTRLGQPGARYAELLSRHDVGTLLDAASSLDPVFQRRFRHVVTESARVGLAVGALQASDMDGFGALMTASHESLRDDYEVSSAGLEELVGAARAAGAVGARLTGAGFGGSIIALVRDADAGGLVEALGTRYYAPRGIAPAAAQCFVAEPAGGAQVIEDSSG